MRSRCDQTSARAFARAGSRRDPRCARRRRRCASTTCSCKSPDNSRRSFWAACKMASAGRIGIGMSFTHKQEILPVSTAVTNAGRRSSRPVRPGARLRPCVHRPPATATPPSAHSADRDAPPSTCATRSLSALRNAGGSLARRYGRQTIFRSRHRAMACSNSGSPGPSAPLRNHRHAQIAGKLPLIHREPWRLASSIKFRHSTARSVISSTCNTRFRFRSRRDASATITVTSGWPNRMKSRAISSSRLVESSEYVPGRIHDLVALGVVFEAPSARDHGFARPVARVLPQAGQRVEDRALAGVRIAGQGDDVIRLRQADAKLLEIRRAVNAATRARLVRGGDGAKLDSVTSLMRPPPPRRRCGSSPPVPGAARSPSRARDTRPDRRADWRFQSPPEFPPQSPGPAAPPFRAPTSRGQPEHLRAFPALQMMQEFFFAQNG
jgi:hypothetical protein